jgi:hypothetical protein
MMVHSEPQRCPICGPNSARLGHWQTERGGKVVGDAEQADRHLTGCWDTRIAGEALCPREARVRPLRARQDDLGNARQSDGRRRQAHLNALMAQQMHADAPVDSATPIPPEQWRRPHAERMQQHTDLTRLGRRTTIPLTLPTKRAGTATVDARSIHHTQASIGFSAVLMRNQVLLCRAPKRSIGPQRKVLAREATCLPC